MTPSDRTHKPSLIVALGIGKPQPKPPSSVRGQLMGGPPAPSSPSPTSSATAPQQESMGQQPQGQKSSRDAANYIAMEQACGACMNYKKETSECAKVEGLFRCCDACLQFFEPANPSYQSVNLGGGAATTETEPDADDLVPTMGGGAPGGMGGTY